MAQWFAIFSCRVTSESGIKNRQFQDNITAPRRYVNRRFTLQHCETALTRRYSMTQKQTAFFIMSSLETSAKS